MVPLLIVALFGLASIAQHQATNFYEQRMTENKSGYNETINFCNSFSFHHKLFNA